MYSVPIICVINFCYIVAIKIASLYIACIVYCVLCIVCCVLCYCVLCRPIVYGVLCIVYGVLCIVLLCIV